MLSDRSRLRRRSRFSLQRVHLAEALTATPAQSFAGAAAKVAVARELIDPEGG
jgi:ABC-type ATPase involved in cell division